MIPNNYSGKTPEQVWNEWTADQREHFLRDHRIEIFGSQNEFEFSKVSYGYSHIDYKELSVMIHRIAKAIIKALEKHISQRQYEKGGIIKTIWNFLNEKVSFF